MTPLSSAAAAIVFETAPYLRMFFVQQFKPLIGLNRVDDDLIVDADHLWRGRTP
jgi:hypothetical protein